jgi:hypothetical protein
MPIANGWAVRSRKVLWRRSANRSVAIDKNKTPAGGLVSGGGRGCEVTP